MEAHPWPWKLHVILKKHLLAFWELSTTSHSPHQCMELLRFCSDVSVLKKKSLKKTSKLLCGWTVFTHTVHSLFRFSQLSLRWIGWKRLLQFLTELFHFLRNVCQLNNFERCCSHINVIHNGFKCTSSPNNTPLTVTKNKTDQKSSPLDDSNDTDCTIKGQLFTLLLFSSPYVLLIYSVCCLMCFWFWCCFFLYFWSGLRVKVSFGKIPPGFVYRLQGLYLFFLKHIFSAKLNQTKVNYDNMMLIDFCMSTGFRSQLLFLSVLMIKLLHGKHFTSLLKLSHYVRAYYVALL